MDRPAKEKRLIFERTPRLSLARQRADSRFGDSFLNAYTRLTDEQTMAIWGFYYQLRGAPKLWVASIVFVVVGAVIEFFLPTLMSQSGSDDQVGLIVVRVLGGVFLALGGLILTMMFVSLYIDRTCPQNTEVWQWWVDFVGGMLGAAAFAVPATFVLPGLYLAYMLSPNPLYPDPSKDFTHDFFIGLLFSALGLLSLAGMYFISRSYLRHRPRWKR